MASSLMTARATCCTIPPVWILKASHPPLGAVLFNLGGRKVTDPRALDRIRSLAIPPAYTDVWICADPRGHIQATGRDDKGRKQYRYHPRWREVRDSTKYERMLDFGKALPAIRERINNRESPVRSLRGAITR